MPDTTALNSQRANHGEEAVLAYCQASHSGTPSHPQEYQSSLGDLLTDLRHLAASMGLDFEAADRWALRRFESEI